MHYNTIQYLQQCTFERIFRDTFTALCLNSIPYSNEQRIRGISGITMHALCRVLAHFPPIACCYRLDALPAAQPPASKHWQQWHFKSLLSHYECTAFGNLSKYLNTYISHWYCFWLRCHSIIRNDLMHYILYILFMKSGPWCEIVFYFWSVISLRDGHCQSYIRGTYSPCMLSAYTFVSFKFKVNFR